MKGILMPIIILCGLILPIQVNSQISRQDNVFYYGGGDKDSLKIKKRDLALAINKYLKEKKRRIRVYFMLNSSDNTELSYDNLKGDLLNLKIYKPKNRWDVWEFSGLRIVLGQKEQELTTLLKLLDYGLNNLKTLKDIYKKLTLVNDYDRPDYLGFPPEQIKTIIVSEPPKDVEIFLKEYE